MQEEEKAAEKAVTDALLKLGNLVHDSVRIDDNEVRQHELVAVSTHQYCLPAALMHRGLNFQDNNPVERTWGVCRQETGLPNHVDLVSMLDIVDLEKGQEVAGSRGYYLKGVVRWRTAALGCSWLTIASHRPCRRACSSIWH